MTDKMQRKNKIMKNKIVIITGGSKGYGAGIVEVLKLVFPRKSGLRERSYNSFSLVGVVGFGSSE